jgi:hypothetical protein
MTNSLTTQSTAAPVSFWHFIHMVPHILWAVYLALVIGVIFNFIQARKTKRASAVAAAKWRSADILLWRRTFRRIVKNLEGKMGRGGKPGRWIPSFKAAIPAFRIVVAAIPLSIDPQKRTEIVAIVDRLCGMKRPDALKDGQKVLDMLHQLEELLNGVREIKVEKPACAEPRREPHQRNPR